jgi:hypothetical protein
MDTRTGKVCECTPEGGVNLAWWHGTKGARWTHFLRDFRRMFGVHDDVQYFRGVEPQRRGALHDHVLVRCRGDVVAMGERVRQLAIRHGFGHEMKLVWMRAGDPSYIAKYVSDACNELANVEWLDVQTGEITRGARCRTWTASRRWGLTRKELKRQQAAWCRRTAAERQAGEQARQGVAGQALPTDVVASRTGPLDSYTASYPGAGSALVEGRGW